jgi:hypothetical protein
VRAKRELKFLRIRQAVRHAAPGRLPAQKGGALSAEPMGTGTRKPARLGRARASNGGGEAYGGYDLQHDTAP